MAAVVGRHQIFERELGVFLSGRKAGVTEQFLDRAEIGAVAQKVCGEGVPQGVGVEGRVAGEQQRIAFHEPLHAARGQSPASCIE